MKRMILVLVALAMAGCGRNNSIMHSYQTNYVIGQPSVAYVGSPILQVTDSYSDSDGTDGTCMEYRVTASSDFAFVGNFTNLPFFRGEIALVGKQGSTYGVKGKTTIGDKNFDMVLVPDGKGNSRIIFIDGSGVIVPGKMALDADSGPMSSALATVTPAAVRLVKSTVKMPCIAAPTGGETLRGVINYELLFGGINNVTMSATYREYTAGDVARSAFFQSLVFETGAKQIRFKNTKINVLKVDNQKIEYVVESDDLTPEIVPYDDPLYSRAKYERMIRGY
ncbi:MAG: hypothetical protein PHP95_08630 [Desulfuromonadaceae bacterium]|nr:hypothetical protein [Desulfuromonadaceae bacterium]MDD2848506.1 hypothetical protein [Desulfuromonadaceae bacterium]MDD4129865.1 hypothetical protein [Desulfuromonadaceae bacterium]